MTDPIRNYKEGVHIEDGYARCSWSVYDKNPLFVYRRFLSAGVFLLSSPVQRGALNGLLTAGFFAGCSNLIPSLFVQILLFFLLGWVVLASHLFLGQHRIDRIRKSGLLKELYLTRLSKEEIVVGVLIPEKRGEAVAFALFCLGAVLASQGSFVSFISLTLFFVSAACILQEVRLFIPSIGIYRMPSNLHSFLANVRQAAIPFLGLPFLSVFLWTPIYVVAFLCVGLLLLGSDLAFLFVFAFSHLLAYNFVIDWYYNSWYRKLVDSEEDSLISIMDQFIGLNIEG